MKAKSSIVILAVIVLLTGSGNALAMGTKGDRMGGKDESTMTNGHSMKKHDGVMEGHEGSMKEGGAKMNDEGTMKKNESMMNHTSKGTGNGAMDGMQKKNSEKTDTMK